MGKAPVKPEVSAVFLPALLLHVYLILSRPIRPE
jgi:hypothetical protein